MKPPISRIISLSTALALLVFFAACGGKDTVASKSARAFREAQQKGTPLGGEAHGGHAAGDTAATATDHATMTGMDHSTMTGMDHATMTGMDHSTMTGEDHSKMAEMDHASMPGMKRGESMAGMDHSKMQMQGRQPMAGMDHATMPGMQHGTAAAPVVVPPPTSNAEIQRLRPAATLKNDPFDAPAQTALAEAAKAVQGRGDEGLARGIAPGEDRENPPTPAPAIRDIPAQGSTSAPAMDHSQHGGQRAPAAQPRTQSPRTTPSATDHSQHGGQSAPAAQPQTQSRGTTSSTAQPAAATIYTCPMHPEVTSDKPGTCPKCGMALVKQEVKKQ